MTTDRSKIELLAPARNFDCVRAAIRHGADAVYIGAPQFSARGAAGNSIDDIRASAEYAHTYGARLHVALNTILFDNEVNAAKELAWQIYNAGTDVLIVQDMALLSSDMPPIELHASTQCDNQTPESVIFRQNLGFRQVVLARELSLSQIEQIARQTTVRLETFIHGALCVSYSGRCYMSLAQGGRSANRGLCAQPCRMAYDIIAADGSSLARSKHVLSLKDNCQKDNLAKLLDIGVSSFKIEGRLKDAAYVANITQFYHEKLESLLASRPHLSRLSSPIVSSSFTPNINKSFNRGFTDYFANGRHSDIWQPHTPKSIGEKIGTAQNVSRNSLSVQSNVVFNNGDGICYIGPDGRTGGMRINSSQGSRLIVPNVGGLRNGDVIYRNQDVAFENQLASDSTRRLIYLRAEVSFQPDILTLKITDNIGIETIANLTTDGQLAQNVSLAQSRFEQSLQKTGGTSYIFQEILFTDFSSDIFPFLTQSLLNDFRRKALTLHTENRLRHFAPTPHSLPDNSNVHVPDSHITAEQNVANKSARSFYLAHGATSVEQAYELSSKHIGQIVMTTKHCIMFSLGRCLRQHPAYAKLIPLKISNEYADYKVVPDCANCQMKIYYLGPKQR